LVTQIRDGVIYQQIPLYNDFGEILGYTWSEVGPAPEGAGGAGGGSSFNDALQAAQSALSGFLQSQSLADARRSNAFEQMQSVANFALPEGATSHPGYGKDGLAHSLAAQMGMPNFEPPPMTPVKMNPAKLAEESPLGGAAQSFIDRVLAAGGARGGARAT